MYRTVGDICDIERAISVPNTLMEDVREVEVELN